jgi:hypothetical protein
MPTDRGTGARVQQILVRFEGEGEGSEELTWSQVAFWHCIRDTGQSATMGGVAPMPAGTTVQRMADMLAYLMGRHQSLRTRLWFGPDGQVRQVCSASGEAALSVVEAGEDDPAELAEQTRQRCAEQNFDYVNEWPFRMTVITKAGAVTHLVVMYLHLALDAGGLAVMLSDMFARDPVTGAPAGPLTAIPPMEQAKRQREPAARRQSAAALKHLEQVMRAVTPGWFGPPRSPGPPTFQMIRFRSPALALAIERIVAEQSVNSSAALLAMFAVGLARHTGDNPAVAMVMVGNRFRPGLTESVSCLVQISPYLIDVAGISLGEAVVRASSSLLHTYKNAYYDSIDQELLIDRVSRELGYDFDFCCLYNDRRKETPPAEPRPPAGDQQILAAVAHSSWAWEQQADMSTRKLFVNVDDSATTIDLVMSADGRYFDVTDLHGLFHAIEAAAVTAALEPGESTGVPAG